MLCYQCTIVSANFAAGIRLRRPVRVCEAHSHVGSGCSGDAVAKTRSLQLPWVHKRSQAPQTHSPYTAMPTCVQSASAQVLRWPKIFIRICHVTTFAWSYTTASSNCTADTWSRRLPQPSRGRCIFASAYCVSNTRSQAQKLHSLGRHCGQYSRIKGPVPCFRRTHVTPQVTSTRSDVHFASRAADRGTSQSRPPTLSTAMSTGAGDS